MRVELDDGAVLARALKAGVALRNSNLPILQCALLEAQDGLLRITTTDTQAYAVVDVQASVIEPGRVCANAGLLAAAARDGRLVLTQADAQPMRAMPLGGSKLRIPTMEANDFPSLDAENWEPIGIDPLELSAAINAVECVAAKDDFRHYLNGVAIRSGGVAATNGKRIGFHPLAYEGPDAIVPLSQITAFCRVLSPDAEIQATLDHGERITKLRAKTATECLSITVLDGRFPTIDPLVAEPDTDQWVTLDRKMFVDAINRFRPFANEKRGFWARLEIADASILLHSVNGENSENVSAAFNSFGTPFEMAINADDIGRICDAVGADKIRLMVTQSAGGKALYVSADDATKSAARFVSAAVAA